MSVSKEDLELIALAARIQVGEDENIYLQELNQAIQYLKVLTEMDLDGVTPTGRIDPLVNTFRDDCATEKFPDEYNLSNAPSLQDNYFRVPRII